MSIHISGLYRLKKLNLARNLIAQFPAQPMQALFNIEELHLEENYINSVEIGALRPTLEKLFLHKNKLVRLNLTDIQNLFLLNDMSFYKNSLDCSCDSYDLFKWIEYHQNIIHKINTTNCATPALLTGTGILNANITRCAVPHRSDVYKIYLPIAISMGIVLVLVLIGVSLMYKYRKEVQVIAYARFGFRWNIWRTRVEQENKVFDAFLAMCEKDREFVEQQLLPQLDHRGYNICASFRNFPVHHTIYNCTEDAINSSRHALVILSKNFLKCPLACHQFQSAHVQMVNGQYMKVKVITIDDVKTLKELTAEEREETQYLATYLSVKQYIEHSDALLMENLVSFLQEPTTYRPEDYTLSLFPPWEIEEMARRGQEGEEEGTGGFEYDDEIGAEYSPICLGCDYLEENLDLDHTLGGLGNIQDGYGTHAMGGNNSPDSVSFQEDDELLANEVGGCEV